MASNHYRIGAKAKGSHLVHQRAFVVNPTTTACNRKLDTGGSVVIIYPTSKRKLCPKCFPRG